MKASPLPVVLLGLGLVLWVVGIHGQSTCTNAVTDGVATKATIALGWGVNWNSQIGAQRGAVEVVRTPTPLQISSHSSPKYGKVASGLTHSAVLETQQGRAFAVGDGTSGQVGAGPQSQTTVKNWNSIGQVLDGSRPTSISTRYTSDVAVGWYHSCVLVEDKDNAQKKNVYCSGRNNKGQLGTNSIRNSISIPTRVDNSTGFGVSLVSAITAGADFTVALTQDGTIWAWGSGTRGELGDGNGKDSTIPVQIRLRSAIKSVECGYRYCLALATNGDLYGWGLNDVNQLGGASTETIVKSPTLITSGVTLYSAGGSHALAVIGGKLYSWGSGTMGQTSQPKNIDASVKEEWSVPTPTAITQFANVAIQSVAAGMKHSLVLDTCGNVYCFGSDALGQCGLGRTLGEKEEYRTMVPKLVGNIGLRKLTGLKVYAGNFNSFYIGQ